MAEISINVNIAERIYPLRINIEEEENIRKAAKLINQKIKEYKENYSVKDGQDVLAMCSLEFVVDKIKAESSNLVEDNGLSERLFDIDQKLSEFFEKH